MSCFRGGFSVLGFVLFLCVCGEVSNLEPQTPSPEPPKPEGRGGPAVALSEAERLIQGFCGDTDFGFWVLWLVRGFRVQCLGLRAKG